LNEMRVIKMKMERIKSALANKRLRIIIVVAVAFLIGYFWGFPSRRPSTVAEGEHITDKAVSQVWTCSMHPQIRRPKPGKCPICFMDLIPVSGSDINISERQIFFSDEAVKLMEIQTSPVERKFVDVEVRMVGKIDYDETRVKNITAWVPGRIDRLYVDFTGIIVNKGDHMVYLYSPELISTQAELLQAANSAKNIQPDSSDLINRSILATLEAARGKMRLLGLTQQQIADIEKTAVPVDHITIYAPIGGVVLHKNASEGMYVDTGTTIYTIADLSRFWVKLDAYEADLPWLRYGQEVEFTTQAYPGEIFKGTITFISPVVDEMTRTIKLRVNVENPQGLLKPQMFVTAVAHSKVAAGGRVMDPALAGKWICPMHPDVIKTEAAKCDICGMDLVTAESLGYVKADTTGLPPLVIPTSAPLITGKRAVVYVRLPDTDKPTFEGREIVLGPKATDYYIVEGGLTEGEVVVTNGGFKIDSALQIQAKPSMMNPQGEQ